MNTFLNVLGIVGEVLVIWFMVSIIAVVLWWLFVLRHIDDDDPIPYTTTPDFIDDADQACALTEVPHTEDDPDLIRWLQQRHPWDELAERRWRRGQ